MNYKINKNSTNLVNGQEITRGISLGMVSLYRRNQYRALVNNGYTQQTRSIYFTINELQEFLEKMEDKNADGCRLYFASVTQEAVNIYAPGSDDLVGAMTVLLVATKTNAGGFHEELLNDGSIVSLPAFDFGTLCPPSGGCSKIMMSPQNSLDFDAV